MKKLWDLKEALSFLELEGQGCGIIMVVTRLLCTKISKRPKHFLGECMRIIIQADGFSNLQPFDSARNYTTLCTVLLSSYRFAQRRSTTRCTGQTVCQVPARTMRHKPFWSFYYCHLQKRWIENTKCRNFDGMSTG